LKKPDPVFWINLTISDNPYMPIICKKYIETVGVDAAQKHPIGSGPYRLVEHKLGDYMKFEAFEQHWRVAPEFKYLIMRMVHEESTRAAMLKTGDIDISPISADRIPELHKAGIGASAWPGGYIISLNFGGMVIPEDKRYVEGYSRMDPWKDIKVREAMNIAIDRKAIVKAIYQGSASPATIGILSPGWNEQQPYPYDPNRAKRLLAEAGYPNGFSLKLNTQPHSPGVEIPRLCEAVAGYWEAIGIKVEIIPGTYAGIRSMLKAVKTAGRVWVLRLSYIEDWTVRFGNYYLPNGTVVYYQDAGIAALGKKLISEMGYEKRQAIWREIAKYLRDNYATASIVTAHPAWGYNSKKVGDWPRNMATRPSNYVYIRHAEPLNKYRLFEIN
ncbi:ABC transporter substrate-binding protein, partial [Thermodesulfobacteriota bacterium]